MTEVSDWLKQGDGRRPRLSWSLKTEAPLVGAADHGLLCCYAFSGEQEWSQPMWSNVGDMAVTGDGETILLACFSQGIQSFEGSGRQVGSYQLDGTVSHVSTSYHPGQIA